MNQMETETLASLKENKQMDSQASSLYRRAETKESQNDDREMRIIIIGASKSGKSTAKDVLLGEEYIKQRAPASQSSSTTTMAEMAEVEKGDMYLKVLVTPDIDCPELRDEKKAKEEIKQWKTMCPDPHLIVLAIRCDTRDLVSDVSRFQRFKKLWGDNLRRRFAVLFTFGDKLQESVDEFLSRSHSALQDVMDCAGHHYVIFNSSLSASEQKGRAQKVFQIVKDFTERMRGCEVDSSLSPVDQMHADVNELKHPCENTQTQLQSCRAADGETQLMPANNTRQLTVLIIGKTGNGKSSLGNRLLNNTSAFIVASGLNSSTTFAVTSSAEVHGLTVTVMDTPDISNLGVHEKAAKEEIKKWCSFHPDIILLAIRCDIRYTAEEHQIYQQIKKVIGKDYLTSKLVVAFTFGDRQDKDIDEELKTVCPELKDVLKDAGNLYILVNKDDSEITRHGHLKRLLKYAADRGNTRRSKRAQKSDGNVTSGKEAKLPTKGASETVHNIQLQLPGRVSRMEPYKEVKSSERFSASHCELL